MSADNVSYLCEGERPTAHYTLYAQKKSDHTFLGLEMWLAFVTLIQLLVAFLSDEGQAPMTSIYNENMKSKMIPALLFVVKNRSDTSWTK